MIVRSQDGCNHVKVNSCRQYSKKYVLINPLMCHGPTNIYFLVKSFMLYISVTIFNLFSFYPLFTHNEIITNIFITNVLNIICSSIYHKK
jgi:hypothetical protein